MASFSTYKKHSAAGECLGQWGPGDLSEEMAPMVRRVPIRILYLALFLWLMPVLWAGHKFPDYPVRAAADYPNKVMKAGLVVAVEPVDDPTQQKMYFDANLVSKAGVLPVFVLIQNTSATDTYLFDKSAIGLGEASEVTGRSARKTTSLLGSGGLVDLAQAKGTTEVVENLRKKEIRSKTLSPGSSLYGFVYVPVSSDAARGKIHLQVPMTSAQSGETLVVNLFF